MRVWFSDCSLYCLKDPLTLEVASILSAKRRGCTEFFLSSLKIVESLEAIRDFGYRVYAV
jgi:hypothetical protein